jgi:hypothetical protein
MPAAPDPRDRPASPTVSFPIVLSGSATVNAPASGPITISVPALSVALPNNIEYDIHTDGNYNIPGHADQRWYTLGYGVSIPDPNETVTGSLQYNSASGLAFSIPKTRIKMRLSILDAALYNLDGEHKDGDPHNPLHNPAHYQEVVTDTVSVVATSRFHLYLIPSSADTTVSLTVNKPLGQPLDIALTDASFNAPLRKDVNWTRDGGGVFTAFCDAINFITFGNALSFCTDSNIDEMVNEQVNKAASSLNGHFIIK